MFVFLMMRQFRLYCAEKDIIKSEQFAKLLLQSTPLDEQDVKEYLQRLESRMQTQIVSECTCYVHKGHLYGLRLRSLCVFFSVHFTAHNSATMFPASRFR